tara:strand:- start:267 stop:1028 length:762 start_codon:yes stop_codon:yes gene_type:complete
LNLIKSKKLSKFKNISHGFFGSKGGVSKGIYKSLNCGIGSSDNKTNIEKNLKIVLKKINSKRKKIFLPKQIHSNKFYLIHKKITNKRIKCDAVITDQKKIPIGVLTADCAPIIIFDPKRMLISLVHAGWKGAFKGIVKKVITFFKKKGSNVKDLIAVIGPCISIKNYEIKKDFMKKFLKKNKKNKIYFKFSKNKIFFDLRKYISFQIKSFGINKLEIINKDTFSGKNSYFSARRSLVKKENDYGRNISLIMIN